jgi:Spy/CpxP family protein refolding chaperone
MLCHSEYRRHWEFIMKLVRKTILLGTLLSCGAAVVTTNATAGTTDSAIEASTPANHPHFRGGPDRGMPAADIDSPFLRAIHQLNLTAEQRTTVHGYLETARQQNRALADQSNIEALANPGDPNYLSAIAAAKNAAAARIQQRSDLQVQVYGLLTPEQQAKLPQVLAEMKARQQQRRADWEQRRQQHSGSPGAAK